MDNDALGIAGAPLPDTAAPPVRAGFIGCGSHAFRNIYPALQFAPVRLVATCDLDGERARRFARQFGADRWYTDHHRMLADEALDAVFVVTNYDDEGRPRFPALAMDAMRAGCHVWIEKPPAASVSEIDAMQAVGTETGRFVMVGFKKCFFPAIQHLKSITERPEFGRPTSVTIRYPQAIPAEHEKESLKNERLRGFLDHIAHPASILQYVMGPVASLIYHRDSTGGGVALLGFRSGAVGTLHLAHGQSGTSPLERIEVVGEGANVVVDNGVKLTYYRPGIRGPGGYGRSPDYIGDDVHAPIVWEPEFSLGQLYNKGLFMLGYAGEVRYFARCVQDGTPPAVCGLDDAREVMKVYEAFLQPPGVVVEMG